MNRRDFLKSSALAAGLALAAQGKGQEIVAEKKLGFAIVGLGRFGAGQLLRSLPECKNCKPVALVSGHLDKAKKLAAQYGINEKSIYNYENFDSIKDNPQIELLSIEYGDWNRAKAKQLTENLLQRFPKIDGAFSPAAQMSMGIVEAFDDAGAHVGPHRAPSIQPGSSRTVGICLADASGGGCDMCDCHGFVGAQDPRR